MENNRVIAKFGWLFASIMLLFMLNACSNNTPLKFYLLDAQLANPQEHIQALSNHNLVIGLGPIHLPDYLNRPQIIRQISENAYQLDEQNRWGEHLEQNISRTLSQFISTRLGLEQLLRHPWPPRQALDYQISLDIFKFHQNDHQISILEAQWQIKHQDKSLMTKMFSCHLETQTDIDTQVKAQSICLGRLGLEIEAGLRQIEN